MLVVWKISKLKVDGEKMLRNNLSSVFSNYWNRKLEIVFV